MSEYITSSDKQMAKKFGKFYLKMLKTIGTLFVFGLIMSTILFATSDPNSTTLTLESGETNELWSFFAESGDDLQFGFMIWEENGDEYHYETDEQHQYYDEYNDEYYTYNNEVDDPSDIYRYMQTMEWLVQVQLQFSEDLSFETFEVVKDVSGEINLVNYEVYQTGFYRFSVTNNHTETLKIEVAKAEVNLFLFIATITVWVLFAISLGIFALSIHFGFWILVIFLIYRAVRIIQEENRREYPQVIGPEL